MDMMHWMLLLTKMQWRALFIIPVVSLAIACVSTYACRPWGITFGICITIAWCIMTLFYVLFKVMLTPPNATKEQ